MFDTSHKLHVPKSLYAVLVAAVVGAAPMASAMANPSPVAPAPVNSRAGVLDVNGDAHADNASSSGLTAEEAKGASNWTTAADRDDGSRDAPGMTRELRSRKGAPVVGNGMRG